MIGVKRVIINLCHYDTPAELQLTFVFALFFVYYFPYFVGWKRIYTFSGNLTRA